MSQKDQILNALAAGLAISPMLALKRFKCFRLASRILEIRKQGWQIDTHRAEGGYAIYTMRFGK